jgi:hypothetical protein
MDPITAVGFAASILTFIDFSHQVVCSTYEIIKSGSTIENAYVSAITTDLDEITKALNQRPSSYSKYEEALNTFAIEYQGV